MSRKSILFIILGIISIIGAIVCILSYNSIYEDNIQNTRDKYEFYIYPSSSYKDVKESLINQDIILDSNSFDVVSTLMSYKKSQVPSGKYIIPNDLSNRELISVLRSGRQTAVNMTFNNVRTLEDLAGKIATNILLDSITILQTLLNDEVQSRNGLTKETFMSLFIPNTYKVYWDINTDQLIERIALEHKKFWNDQRINKAKSVQLNPEEVYTLASIVDKESLLKIEKPRIAGVYLNRLSKGIPLQADPTVVFALKKFDLRRVLNKHLEFDSPYNTYLYAGLPPGPIAMSSISGIDAVLENEKHEFLYFCAKPNGKGQHAFAKTLKGHNKNARLYWNWLNSRGIR